MKTWGLFRKKAGRNGTFGSRPLDRDHAAQDEAVPRSNLGRASRIGRPREVGRGAAALTAGAEAPAAARRRSNAQTRSRPWLGLGFGPGERARHG